MTTYIIGHTKPDTDATVAALALKYLYDRVECFAYQDAVPLIAGPLNPETSYIFERFGIPIPRLLSDVQLAKDDQIVLVDHNELSQRPPGIADAKVVDIIDHHKANLDIPAPIYMTFKPWGSSSTIVYWLMEQHNVTPSKALATLMLCAVLSDTVGYKSSTCTDRDVEVGKALANIAEIDDIEALTLDIFAAKSDISSLSDEEIVRNDYKVFEFNKPTFIGQLETVDQTFLLTEKKEALLKAMNKVKSEEKVELLFLVLTDILNVNSKVLILSDDELTVAEAAFGGTTSNNVLDIGPLMSRKKEIAPAIEKAL